MHRFDHLAEANRRSELVGKESTTSLGSLWIDIRRLVGIHIDRSGAPLHIREVSVKGLARVRDDARVERRRNRQTDRAQAGSLELIRHRVDGFDRSSQDHLGRRVVIRDHDVVRRVDQPGHRLGVAGDRDHGTRGVRSGPGHELATLACRREQGTLRDATGSSQCGQFTEAVSSHGIRLETEVSEQVQEAQAHRRDRRLSRRHRSEVRGLLGPLFGCECRRREDRTVQSVVRELFHVDSGVPHGAHAIEGDGRMGTHAHVLTSLTWEDEGELADRGCAEAESNIRIRK